MHRTPNPFAFRAPITLDTLDELFGHHRSMTGGWKMMADGDGDDDKGKGGGDAFQPITSQADLDKVLGQRLVREREKFADYDSLKEKAAAHDAAIDAARTESEKAVDAARKEGETTATERANARIVAAEARALAATEKFRNPVAAVKLLDLTGVSVGADGEVDAEALKAKLKALAESDPYLVDDGKKAPPKPDRTQGGGGAGPDSPSVSRGREMFESKRGTKKTSA